MTSFSYKGRSKLSEMQRKSIKALKKRYSKRELASIYKVSESNIAAIWNDRCRKQIMYPQGLLTSND